MISAWVFGNVLAALLAAVVCSFGPRVLAASEPTGLEARGTLSVLTTPEEYPEWFSLQARDDPGFERELLEGFAQLHPSTSSSPRFSKDGATSSRASSTPPPAASRSRSPMRCCRAATWPSACGRTARRRRPRNCARKVGVLAGTTWADVARQHVPASQVVTFNREDEVVAALRAGRVTASVVASSEYLSMRRAVPELDAGVFLGERASAAWAVRRADTDLRSTLDRYLTLKKQSMGFSRLLVKYFGADAAVLLDRAAQ